jgi:hypothetical protein
MVKDEETIPGFHAVEFMRQAREELSREMEGKSFEEFQRFLHEKLEKSELWQRLQQQTPTSSR